MKRLVYYFWGKLVSLKGKKELNHWMTIDCPIGGKGRERLFEDEIFQGIDVIEQIKVY